MRRTHAADAATGRHQFEQQQQQRAPEAKLLLSVTLAASYLWDGVSDSFAWPVSLFVVYGCVWSVAATIRRRACLFSLAVGAGGSLTLRKRVFQCVVLNGLIFLGSVLAFDHIAAPAARTILAWPCRTIGICRDLETVTKYLGAFSTIVYYMAWIYPLYVVSFFMSGKWYQDIADRSFQIFVGTEAQPQPMSIPRLLRDVVSDAYRGLLIFNYMLQVALVYYLPYIGHFISLLLFNFILSFLAFEYKWAHKKWSLGQKIEYFETHWIYFIGFDLSMTLFSYFFPQAINMGLFAVVFPMYVIMATRGRPVPTRKTAVPLKWIPSRLRIFLPAQMANSLIIGWIKHRREAAAAAASSASAETTTTPSFPDTSNLNKSGITEMDSTAGTSSSALASSPPTTDSKQEPTI